MTEIPEHLLKRAAQARARLSGGAPEGDADSASTSAAPAVVASTTTVAAKAPAAPVKVVKPPSPMVEAYQKRHKIPYWAMPVVAALPIWGYMFMGTLDPPPVEAIGEELYLTNCQSCHGAEGGGGSGPAFTGGEVYKTWPDFLDHFEWVRLGTDGFASQGETTYGANSKPLQGTGAKMPAFNRDVLSDAALLEIIYHERELGGANPDEEDMLLLEEAVAIAEENPDMSLEEILSEIEGFDDEVPEVAKSDS